MDREYIDQTPGSTDYGSANNVKHSEMEDALMNFASSKSERDTAFTKLTTTHDNLYTKLRQQEDQIRALKAELCNLEVH